MSPLENLHANKTIEHHGNENDKPREREKHRIRVVGEKCRVGRDIPYGSIEENYSEEHPFGRNRTPKLSRLHPIGRASLNLGLGHSLLHCHK